MDWKEVGVSIAAMAPALGVALAILVLEHPCGGIVQRPCGCAQGLSLLTAKCRCAGALAPERSADTA